MNYDFLVDLHLHIDGAISVDSALHLAEMQGITLPTEDKNELKKLLTVPSDCRDLNEYLERFALPGSLMQTKEAISEAVYILSEELKNDGLIYAELRFAPQKHTGLGLTQEEVVLSAIDGLNRSDFCANLILCCMRDDGNEKENMETVRLADKYREKGVVAVDLAGAESLFATRNFKTVFDYAKALNLNCTIHAGEADGYKSVETALSFGAKRIGHGVRAIESKEIMAELKEKKIALEMCPTSNLQTKAVDKIENYPIREFINRGIVVTINTDNPVVSGTSMKKEIELVKNAFDLTDKEIYTLILNSINYSFANDKTKKELISRLDNAFLSVK